MQAEAVLQPAYGTQHAVRMRHIVTGTQHAVRMRHIVTRGLPLSTVFSHIIS
jgi:hypothetical protein